MVSPLSSTWYLTISEPRTWICGNLTAGRKTIRAASIFTTIAELAPRGDTRPDYGRQEVRRYIRDYVFLWLEKYRCDGIRIDAVSYIRHTEGANQGDQLDDGLVLLRQIIGEIKTKYPHKIVIAEDMQGDTFITEPLEEGGLGFDAQWDTKFVHPVRRVLEGEKRRAPIYASDCRCAVVPIRP